MAKVHKKIKACIITTGHLAANPRLVKEATALIDAGIDVHIIFTQYVDYLFDHDQKILAANPQWTYQALDWGGRTLVSKYNRLTGGLMRLLPGNNTKINRNFWWQLKKAIAYPADIYIGHNPGAIAVTAVAAKIKNAKSGFDAEDFHRNETSDDENNPDVKLKTAIENANFPQFDYLIAASPQIAKKYSELFNRNVTSILNVFPKTHLDIIINNTKRPLRLFWFSQTIGCNRGLENVIDAINRGGIKMELHLLGKVGDDYKKQLLDSNDKHQQINAEIHFHKPVPGDEILKLTPMFDIGLAAEPGFSTNNRIALSNKLFTYIQCGIAVVSSNTVAQSWFMDQYPETGMLYNNVEELVNILLTYHHNRGVLYETKKAAYHIGQTALNWEIEREKFIEVVTRTLHSA